MAKDTLVWNDIDIDNLSPPMAALHKAMLDAKAAFEQGMIAAMREKGIIQPHQTAIFSHRRGVGYAITDITAAKGRTKLAL